MSAAGDGGDDGDFGVGGKGCGEAAGIANAFVADEDVDVFADMALLGDDAIANTGVKRIQGGESVGDEAWRFGQFDFAAAFGELAQGAGDVKDDGHGQRLLGAFLDGGFLDEVFLEGECLREAEDFFDERRALLAAEPAAAAALAS